MEYLGAILACIIGALPIGIILYLERVNGEWL